MSEKKFKGTPGPWRVDDYGHYIWSPDTMMVAELRGWGHLAGAPMKLSHDDACLVQDANAKLIAAAPTGFDANVEALAALEHVWDALMADRVPDMEMINDAIKSTRAAIAKALGDE